MPPRESQIFLRDLDKKPRVAAEKLQSNLDAALHKHTVRRAFFLKYVSDFFAQRQAKIKGRLKDSGNDFFFDPNTLPYQQTDSQAKNVLGSRADKESIVNKASPFHHDFLSSLSLSLLALS